MRVSDFSQREKQSHGIGHGGGGHVSVRTARNVADSQHSKHTNETPTMPTEISKISEAHEVRLFIISQSCFVHSDISTSIVLWYYSQINATGV